MPVSKRCGVCGEVFEARNARAKFCSAACRSRNHRGDVVELRPATESDSHGSSGVEAATRRELEAADRVNTTAGAAALALAQRIDAGQDLGSAVASMVRELRATMSEALEGVKVSSDGVDELRAQAEKRRLRLAGS